MVDGRAEGNWRVASNSSDFDPGGYRAGSAQKEPPPRWWVFRGEGEGIPPLRRILREIATKASSRRGSPLRRPRGVVAQIHAFPTSARGSFHSSTVSNLNRNQLPSRVGSARTSSERRPRPNPREKPSSLRPLPHQGNAGWCHASVRSVDHEESASGVSGPPVDSNVGQLQPIELPQFKHL